jgi:hypothetical protein
MSDVALRRRIATRRANPSHKAGAQSLRGEDMRLRYKG